MFLRHAALLFIAFRAADAVNLVAGLYLVPKFVASGDLGAVLPLVTFATALATPAFAFAFVLMRESNALASARDFGRLKSLLLGSFVGTASLLVLSLAIAALFIPRFVTSLNAGSRAVAFAAVVAAFAGSFAPVYSDALNGLKRFGAYGLIEIAAALGRVGTMIVIMPFHAMLGFFCGNAAQPLVRIGGAVAALGSELKVTSEIYWTLPVLRRLGVQFAGVLATTLPPMLISLAELSLVRTGLVPDASAQYYLETRMTSVLGYLTLPILLVLFPYAAQASRAGRSTRPLVVNSSLSALAGAAILAVAYGLWGEKLMGLFPDASSRTPDPNLVRNLMTLLVIEFSGAVTVFYTNAQIAAGRFRHLAWFVPLHLAYAAILSCATLSPRLEALLAVFAAFAVVRLACVAVALGKADTGA